MDVYLEVRSQRSTRLVPVEDGRLSVGRGDGCDLTVDDPEVSRLHAVVERVGAGWTVADLGSRNGTAVNGVRVGGRRALRSGDEVTIGDTTLVFRDPAGDHGATTVGAAPPPELTRRERDVLVALVAPLVSPGHFAEPAATRTIADALHVSDAAVKQHLSNLYDKFAIHDRAARRRVQLANEALRRGAVTLADVRAGAEHRS
jgi:hypothetical protein